MNEKLKSDRLWALAGYAVVVVANAYLDLGLEHVPDDQTVSPLLTLGGAVMTFILGKSWRSTVPEQVLEAGTVTVAATADAAAKAAEDQTDER